MAGNNNASLDAILDRMLGDVDLNGSRLATQDATQVGESPLQRLYKERVESADAERFTNQQRVLQSLNNQTQAGQAQESLDRVRAALAGAVGPVLNQPAVTDPGPMAAQVPPEMGLAAPPPMAQQLVPQGNLMPPDPRVVDGGTIPLQAAPQPQMALGPGSVTVDPRVVDGGTIAMQAPPRVVEGGPPLSLTPEMIAMLQQQAGR